METDISRVDFVFLADCIWLQSDLQQWVMKSKLAHPGLTEEEWDKKHKRKILLWWMGNNGYDEQVIKILVDLI